MPDANQQQEVSAAFPTSGIDVTCEFGRQPTDTTPDAVNVTSNDVIFDRLRGGSRVGLAKFINFQHSGDFPIQHLNILVDPQAPTLRAEFDEDDPTGVDDPSTNNNLNRNVFPANPNNVRRVRGGGSGRQPALQGDGVEPSPPPPPATGTFRLTITSVSIDDGSYQFDATYENSPGNGIRAGMTVIIQGSIPVEPPASPTPGLPPGVEEWITVDVGLYDEILDAVTTFPIPLTADVGQSQQGSGQSYSITSFTPIE